jgi:hypothetical protein
MGMPMTHRCKRFTLALLLATTGPFLCAQQAHTDHANEKKPVAGAAADDPYRVLFLAHQFEQVALSPDGKKVAWVEQLAGEGGTANGKRDVYATELETSRAPVRVSAGSTAHYDEGDLAWSPDSQQLAFLSDVAEEGHAQLYVMNMNGGDARKLTGVKGFLATCVWRIATRADFTAHRLARVS